MSLKLKAYSLKHKPRSFTIAFRGFQDVVEITGRKPALSESFSGLCCPSSIAGYYNFPLQVMPRGKSYNGSMTAEKSANSSGPLNFSQYRENWTSREGKAVILRSITSADKRIEKELIDGLSFQSSRYRFFHVIKEASEEMVNKFCDIDYKNEVAIIAEYNAGDQKSNVGVVRLFIDQNLKTGEFAILVADKFQNSGLGTKFMEILLDIAGKEGLKSIYGMVQPDNLRMLTLMKEFGFSIGPNLEGEVKITREL